MEWTAAQEAYLTRLHHEAHTLEEFNRKQVQLFTQLQRRFSIPIMALSGINSLAAVCLQDYLLQSEVSIINACLSLLTGVLGSIQMFLRVDSKIHTHAVCSHEFGKLAHKISKELSVEREVRCSKGRDFLLEAFNEFLSILDKCEPKTRRLTNHLLLMPEDSASEVSSDPSL